MRTAVSVLRNRGKGSACVTDDKDLVPPLLRLLLDSGQAKGISEIHHDYELTTCERMAVAMVKDEDPDFKIKTVKVDAGKLSTQGKFEVASNRTGHALLYRNQFTAGVLRGTGPNVDISQRSDPKETEKHTGVHTVHRLYMAAAFRVLLGGQDIGANTGVAALFVAPDGRIMAWSKKNPSHPLLHAEASALLYLGRTMPKGTRVYSTLKPCKMCRSLIEHFADEGSFVAYYGQDDPTLAAMGPMDGSKYVYMAAANPIERPIWSDNDKQRDRLLRKTVTQDLGSAYGTAHEKQRDLGIIDFIKGSDKAAPHLKKAANYLQVKQQKYSNPKLEAVYNPNVQRCLAHITGVLQGLGLPVPVKV